MSVNSVSNLYERFFLKWKKCRDVISGEDIVKSFRELYLPRASGMDDDDYRQYLTRAQFFNASGRTLDGLCGMINRKPIITTVPEGLEKYLENVDGKGHSLNQFGNKCVKDVLITGWGGVLVDMPHAENVVSQRDFENSNLYAYMTYYKAESIIKWRWANDGRKQYLKYVVFKEDVEVDSAEYETQLKSYFRLCEIDEDGFYRQTLWNCQ